MDNRRANTIFYSLSTLVSLLTISLLTYSIFLWGWHTGQMVGTIGETCRIFANIVLILSNVSGKFARLGQLFQTYEPAMIIYSFIITIAYVYNYVVMIRDGLTTNISVIIALGAFYLFQTFGSAGMFIYWAMWLQHHSKQDDSNITDRLIKSTSKIFASLAEQCCICLDGYSRGDLMSELVCGHRYHSKCITTWLEQEANCPYCRANMKPDVVIDLSHMDQPDETTRLIT